jgi:hypothetical protein
MTCNNKYRMDWRLYAQQLEFFCSSGIHSSGVQCPATKLKVDTSSIIFNHQEAITQKPYFRKPIFI